MSRGLREIITDSLESTPQVEFKVLPNNPGIMDVVFDYAGDLAHIVALKKCIALKEEREELDIDFRDDYRKGNLLEELFYYKKSKKYYTLRRFITIEYTPLISIEEREEFLPVLNHFQILVNEINSYLEANHGIDAENIIQFINTINKNPCSFKFDESFNKMYYSLLLNQEKESKAQALLEYIKNNHIDVQIIIYVLAKIIPYWNKDKWIEISHTKEFTQVRSPFRIDDKGINQTRYIDNEGELAMVIKKAVQHRFRINGVYKKCAAKYLNDLQQLGFRFRNKIIKPENVRIYIGNNKYIYILKCIENMKIMSKP